MKKRMTCAVLVLTLCLGLCPAFAAEEKFPAVNTYPGYADVTESDWFYSNARLCYEVGLMTGTDVGFEPNKVLTQAECSTLALRLYLLSHGGDGGFETAPAGWGYFTLTTADGKTLEGYADQEELWYCSSHKYAADLPAVRLETAVDEAWAKGLDGKAATFTLDDGQEISGTMRYRARVPGEGYALCFDPTDPRLASVLTSAFCSRPGPDKWWRNAAYTAQLRGVSGLGFSTAPAERRFFVRTLSVTAGELEAINSITSLPGTRDAIAMAYEDAMALAFYNAGILTGVDKYGTFDGGKTLTRAEAAAMVSRIVKPELRLRFTPADYSPFTAAYLTPGTVMFDNGLTAEEYLIAVNNAISAWEAALGDQFNWHYIWTDGKTVLDHVKDDSLSALGVAAKQGTQAYKDFDVQVYYSRLIDLTGGPLGRTDAPEKAGETRRDYTLTAVELPDGWKPTGDSNNAAAGWVSIQRGERETWECAVYRSDGTILELDGYVVYGGESPRSLGDATRCLVCRGDLWNAYDVEEGRLLLEQSVVDGDENFWDRLDPCFPASDQPWPTRDDTTGLYGYKDKAGNWAVPPRYVDMWYLGDGMFNYWGQDWQTDCGLVSIDGVETPTETFSNWFNGGLTANYGLIAMGFNNGDNWCDAYYDYAGNQVSQDFDWAGPIGDDGAGFVCKDGGLFRIQF